jgi:hypothetical protein
MHISVDGTRREAEALPETIGGLISGLKSDLLADGKVVLSVSVDGRVADAEYQREIADRPAADFGEVSVETADPKALCLATLEEVRNHIQPIIDESGRISELIDTGKEAQALGRIIPCVEVWGAIVKAVHNIAQLMQVDINEVATSDEALSETLRSLVDLLQSIRNHMESRDLVSIRDVMKHEMPEVARRVGAQLEGLSNLVAAK